MTETYMHGVLEKLPEEPKAGKTPRTDEEERWAEWNGQEFKCVDSSFARELERELIASRSLLDAAKQIRDDLKLRAEFNKAGGYPVVDVSDGIWTKFCEAIDDVELSK